MRLPQRRFSFVGAEAGDESILPDPGQCIAVEGEANAAEQFRSSIRFIRARALRMRPASVSSTNSGGLSVWFPRAERYEPKDGMPYRSVEERAKEIQLLCVIAFIEID